MRVVGAVLVVLGFSALIWRGIPYNKTDKIAEIGGIRMQVTEKKELAVPPVIGGLAIAIGTAMLLARRRRDGGT